MSFEHGLELGTVLSNEELVHIFKCNPQGGMRRSLQTNTLAVISNHIDSIYEDRWHRNVFYYSGIGLSGDQSLDYAPNKTLVHAQENGIEVYLFEVFEPHEYMFMGQMELKASPYQEIQPDGEGHMRKVWIFPLSPVGELVKIEQQIIDKKNKLVKKKLAGISDEMLRQRILYADRRSASRQVLATNYTPNPYIGEYIKRQAKGICQLCQTSAPFIDKNGSPYLEIHHIVWLSKGGDDSIENTVALCPNCHRKMHILDDEADKRKLTQCNLLFQ